MRDLQCKLNDIWGRLFLSSLIIVGLVVFTQFAYAVSLIKTTFSAKSNDVVKITLDFDGTVTLPSSFVIQTPQPSIVVDFPNVTNKLKSADELIDLGLANNLLAVQAQNRTRLVINLKQMITKKDFRISQPAGHKNQVIIAINGVITENTAKGIRYQGRRPPVLQPYQIDGIDFRRNEKGGGKIVIKTSSPNVNVNVEEKGQVVVADFMKTSVPRRLQRRLDVRDFDTPVQYIQLQPYGRSTRITVNAKGLYQHLVYQMGNTFIINIRPLTENEKKSLAKKSKLYSGERISLNFQDIRVRSVLQLLAEFTGLNVVVSDSVSGNITLRLKDVPWDQALDIVLKTQGLAERRVGNVILIAPQEEIAARERQELEADQQVADLAPIQSELIQVNYANAAEVAALLTGESSSILSDRGTVSVDERTNTLWVQDTATKLAEVKAFIKQLDVPVKQVIIKSRIVNVEKTFNSDIGVDFGLTRGRVTGTLTGSNELSQTGVNAVPVEQVPINQRLGVNLPATGVGTSNGAASIGVALARLGSGTLLDLELSALETEGGVEIISSPTVITSNQQQALIEQGVEIPYQQATSSGATTVAFKKAVLSLQVTPQITPDNRIILTLQVNQDTAGEEVLGTPSINTREVQTQVLVDSGETIVLGGIYEQEKRNSVLRVPFLGSLPIVGRLFRRTTSQNDRRELMIFITPKIIKQQLAAPE